MPDWLQPVRNLIHMPADSIKTKRIYEKPEANDGFRILVDRLWPRGLKKERAAIDLWLKEIAPSNDLRKWFGHEKPRWEDFRKRYGDELAGKADLLASLSNLVKEKGKVTLLFAASDEAHNNAVALKEFIESGSPLGHTG